MESCKRRIRRHPVIRINRIFGLVAQIPGDPVHPFATLSLYPADNIAIGILYGKPYQWFLLPPFRFQGIPSGERNVLVFFGKLLLRFLSLGFERLDFIADQVCERSSKGGFGAVNALAPFGPSLKECAYHNAGLV